MLQQVRTEGAELEQQMGKLEEDVLQSQQQLQQREGALFESRRAHRTTATQMARSLSELEIAYTPPPLSK